VASQSTTNPAPLGPAVFFDRQGNALRLRRSQLARQLGVDPAGFDPVRQLGFVRVRPMGRALVVEFAPAVASPLAVVAAFYEIADRAPARIVLACRGDPDRSESFRSVRRAICRIGALARQNLEAPPPG
jgi:hypothetical protein